MYNKCFIALYMSIKRSRNQCGKFSSELKYRNIKLEQTIYSHNDFFNVENL